MSCNLSCQYTACYSCGRTRRSSNVINVLCSSRYGDNAEMHDVGCTSFQCFYGPPINTVEVVRNSTMPPSSECVGCYEVCRWYACPTPISTSQMSITILAAKFLVYCICPQFYSFAGSYWYGHNLMARNYLKWDENPGFEWSTTPYQGQTLWHKLLGCFHASVIVLYTW